MKQKEFRATVNNNFPIPPDSGGENNIIFLTMGIKLTSYFFTATSRRQYSNN